MNKEYPKDRTGVSINHRHRTAARPHIVMVRSVFHLADREPCHRPNDAACVCVGEFPALSGPGQTGTDLAGKPDPLALAA